MIWDRERALDETQDADRPVCGFCQGEPVHDAASWLDGVRRGPVPCPRCGQVSQVDVEEAA